MKRYRIKTESIITRYYIVDALSEDHAALAFYGEGGRELRNQQTETGEVVIEVQERRKSELPPHHRRMDLGT